MWGGSRIKTPVLNNFSPIYYWGPIFWVGYRQTMYFLEKYMKYPFYPFYPFFWVSKCPRSKKKRFFWTKIFVKLRKKSKSYKKSRDFLLKLKKYLKYTLPFFEGKSVPRSAAGISSRSRSRSRNSRRAAAAGI